MNRAQAASISSEPENIQISEANPHVTFGLEATYELGFVQISAIQIKVIHGDQKSDRLKILHAGFFSSFRSDAP
jgi:hypothetical protein